jgi:hypothetical protein
MAKTPRGPKRSGMNALRQNKTGAVRLAVGLARVQWECLWFTGPRRKIGAWPPGAYRVRFVLSGEGEAGDFQVETERQIILQQNSIGLTALEKGGANRSGRPLYFLTFTQMA